MYDSQHNGYQLSSNPTYEGDAIGVVSQHNKAPSSATAIAVPGAAVRELQKAVASLRCTPRHQLLGKFALAASDLVTLCIAFLIGRMVAWSYHDAGVPKTFAEWLTNPSQLRIVLFSAIACGVVMWFWGVLSHYTRRRPYWDEVREVAVVVLFAFMLDAMIVYLGKWQFSRLALGSAWVAAFLLLPLTRLIVRRKLNTLGWFRQPYVIIGRGAEAAETIAALNSEPLMGFEPVAIIAPPGMPRTQDVQQTAPGGLPTYQLDDQLLTYLRHPGPLRVVIVLDNGAREGEAFKALVQNLCLTRDDVFLVPAISGLPLIGMEISHFFSHEVLLLRARNNLNRRSTRILKRAFDIVVSLALLALLGPLMLIVGIKVRRDGGSALYGHLRIGLGGREFPCLKFRSMVVNADEVLKKLLAEDSEARIEWARALKLKNDPRVTPIGAFLRRTSLDELPQLINVLRGEMSLVGPRPIVRAELIRYGDVVEHYLKVRPGMTGLWQVSGRSETDYQRRVLLDRWYVQNWSLWSDIVILIRTVRVVLRSEGAY